MDKREARKKFEQSKTLFAQNRYPEAMIVLDELNAAYPNEKHIMYARAMCLAELQRPLEAIQLCEQAVAMHNDPKSQALLGRLRREHGPIQEGPTDLASLLDKDAHAGGLGGLGAGAGIPDIPSVPDVPDYVEMPQQTSNKRFYIILGCVVGAVLILAVGFPLLASLRRQDRVTEAEPAVVPAPIEDTAVTEPPTEPVDAPPPEPIQWYYNYDEGMRVARDFDRPACVFFHDGGPESARIEQTIFQDPVINQTLSQFINIRVLVTEDDPAMRRHGIDRVPAVVVQDTQQNTIYSAENYAISANDLRAELSEMETGVAPERAPQNDLPEIRPAFILLILLSFLLAPWPLYLTLMFTGKLPYAEFLKNLLMVSLVAWGTSVAASIIPAFGTIIVIFILYSIYDMGFLDFIIYFALRLVYWVIIVLVFIGVMGPAIVEQIMEMGAS